MQIKMNKYKLSLIICLIVAVFIVGGVLLAKFYPRKSAENSGSSKNSKSLTISPLDGIGYPADKAKRHPLAVMVENLPAARPQFGLSGASVVYEAITEGGITRYMAIYGPRDAETIGPIRSARLFFMDWLKEYDGFYAHAGGNEDALAKIGAYGIKNLDHNANYYYRDRKGRNVASEHTLYSSTDKLYQYAAAQKFDVNSSSYTAVKFKKDGGAQTAGKGVEINFSSASYKVRWSYNATENNYSRFLSGTEDKDTQTKEQLKAKNIIVQQVSRTLQPTGSYGSENWVMTTQGNGKATVYRDGQEISATWKKDTLTSRTKFYDANNKELEFNPGTTWYEIVPPDVKYSAI